MIILNRFKYDYNNKVFLINLVLSLVFLILSIAAFEKIVGFIILLIMSVILLLNSFFVIRAQGIILKSNKDIIIVDQLFVRKLRIDDVSYVSLKPIPKDTKSNIYGFVNEFFYPNTYTSHCDYVYNQGKVYNIYFHLNDGTVVESYFGWLYREKEKTVNKVEKKLTEFIEKINILCKENRED